MPDITAADAARHFAELLDGVVRTRTDPLDKNDPLRDADRRGLGVWVFSLPI